MIIYTHENPDLDALASLWAVLNYDHAVIKGNAQVIFRPGNWDGAEMVEGDIAVDIEAGGKGINGVLIDNVRHSCFATLVTRYLDESDQEAIANLVAYIDAQDTYGSAVKRLLPDTSTDVQNIISFSSINSVFRALQSMNYRKDGRVMSVMHEIFSGMLKTGRARQRAVKDAENAIISPCGNVAIISPKEYGTNAVLFDGKGVRIIIYVDGFNLGIIRKDTEILSMSDQRIVEFVSRYDDVIEWFAHPSGFMFCRGSRKSQATSMSQVPPTELMAFICEILKT